MKKKVMLGVIAAMVVSMSATVFAAPSIGQIIPRDPEIITSTLYDEWKLRVQAIDGTDEKALDAYTKIEALKSILKTVNDEKNKPTIEQIEDALKELKVEDIQKVKTESEEEIDLTEYKLTTQFVDLALVRGDEVKYTLDEDIEVKIAFEAAKDKKAEDLAVVMISPETGKVAFITFDEDDFDPKTGEMKVKLPFLGAMTILDKSAEAAE